MQNKRKKTRAVLFDAGNTVVFPRVDLMAAILNRLGYPATMDDFYQAEREGKQRLDDWLWPQIRSGNVPAKADYYYWTEYLRALVERVSVPEAKQQAVALELAEGFKEITTWSRVFPGAVDYLKSLRQRGYRLGVVSNSLGLIERQLNAVGLAECFEFILDSHYVGFEKPSPEIFRLALAQSGAEPSEALFVGDLYSTDVGGAENAGLTGVLIDWVGAYSQVHVPRITALHELDALLDAPS